MTTRSPWKATTNNCKSWHQWDHDQVDPCMSDCQEIVYHGIPWNIAWERTPAYYSTKPARYTKLVLELCSHCSYMNSQASAANIHADARLVYTWSLDMGLLDLPILHTNCDTTVTKRSYPECNLPLETTSYSSCCYLPLERSPWRNNNHA